MPAEATTNEHLIEKCEPAMDALFARCAENAPNFGVLEDCFKDSLKKTLRKFLLSTTDEPIGPKEVNEFLEQIQADDLFMALACANGNERAWWDFDQQHRSYLERVARHLAKTDLNAQEVVDQVYFDLYGSKVVDGERVSKFGTYSGRGSLRGWLRTVVWHSLVDMHRGTHDVISLDEMTENVGEGAAHANFAHVSTDREDEMIEHLARERYRKTTVTAIGKAFASLEDYEKLLLLYYHVENLKLREIARLAESETSPLRGWFQRKSSSREKDPSSRVHESTIMRWLEKSYGKVLQTFRSELQTSGLQNEEIEICMELATQDLAGSNFYGNLSAS